MENAPIGTNASDHTRGQYTRSEISHQILARIVQHFDTSALIRDAVLSSFENQEFPFLQRLWKSSFWQGTEPTREIFLEMLTTSIVRKRDPKDLDLFYPCYDVKDSIGWKERLCLLEFRSREKTKRNRFVLPLSPKF